MCSPTFLLFRAFFCFRKFAKLWRVVIVISSLVFDRMIIVAALVIVGCVLFVTFNSLEVSQIKVFDVYGLSSAVMQLRKSVEIAIIIRLMIGVLVLFVVRESFLKIHFSHFFLSTLFI